MAYLTETVSVGTSPTVIVDGAGGDRYTRVEGFLKVPSGGVDVFIGGENVDTTGNGTAISATEKEEFSLVSGDRILGVVATGSQDVEVHRRRK